MSASAARDLFDPAGTQAVVLRVHAVPGARRNEVAGVHGNALKVRVAAPPERGRANEAITRLLAGGLGVPASAVELVAGGAGRAKRFRVEGVDPEAFAERLARLLAGEGADRTG